MSVYLQFTRLAVIHAFLLPLKTIACQVYNGGSLNVTNESCAYSNSEISGATVVNNGGALHLTSENVNIYSSGYGLYTINSIATHYGDFLYIKSNNSSLRAVGASSKISVNNVKIVNNNPSGYGLSNAGLNASLGAHINVNGNVEIEIGQGEYQAGIISYDAGSFILIEGDVSIIHNGNEIRGAGITNNGTEGVVIVNGNTIIRTAGAGAVSSNVGKIYLKNVTITQGDNNHPASNALRAANASGYLEFHSSNVETSGKNANAIFAESGSTIKAIGESNLETKGENSVGIYALGVNSNITLTGKSKIQTHGEKSDAIRISEGNIATDNVKATTYGNNASGLSVSSDIKKNSVKNIYAFSATSLIVNTYGENSNGILIGGFKRDVNGLITTSMASGSVFISENLTINSEGLAIARDTLLPGCGLGAAICMQGNDSILISNGSSYIKSNGHAIQLEKGNSISISLTGSNINTSGTFPLIEVNTDNGTSAADITKMDLTNSSATAGNNGKGLLLNVGTSSNLKFTASNSQLYGGIKAAADSTVNMEMRNGSTLTGYIDPINLYIDGSSAWNLTANSELENLTNAGNVSFTDSGTSNTFKTISVDSYVGEAGSKLSINTYLDNDASKSDNLIISNLKTGTKVSNTTIGGPTDGGTATGQTSIYVTNRGGLGAQTVDKGILVVHALQGTTPATSATTTLNAFSLGHTVSAGAYEYSLYRNDDESWYLFSSQNQKDPDYSDEGSATPVLGPLAQLYNTAILGSWRERMGGMAYADPAQLSRQRSAVAPLWVRMGGGQGHHKGGEASFATMDSITYNSDYRYDFNFLQMGGDVYQQPTEQGGRQVGGVYLTTGSIYSDVFSYDELTAARSSKATLAKVDNISLGAYWTQIGADGSYMDIVGQYSDHDLTVRQADNVTGSGHTWAASIEAGKAMTLNSAWTLVPQAQLRWQNIRFKDMTAIASQKQVGTYRFHNNNSLEARLGLEARYKTGPLNVAWMRLDMLHEFKGRYTSQYTPVQTGQAQPQFTSSRKGSSVELLGGMELEVAKNVGVYGTLGYRQGLSKRTDHAWNAQLGVRWGF